jgi:hypothetical protein
MFPRIKALLKGWRFQPLEDMKEAIKEPLKEAGEQGLKECFLQ